MQKHLLTCRLFTVEQRTYEADGEDPVQRDVVVHPGAAVILPILDEHHIVMIRNHRHAVGRELWELPAGTLEPPETPIETARRELEEETGYRAASVIPIMEFFTTPGICTERMYAFLATDLTEVGQNLQSGERIVAEKVEMAEARRNLLAGKYLDGKTIAVLGRYFLESDAR